MPLSDNFSINRLFMTKDIRVAGDGVDFIFHCPTIKEMFLNEALSLTLFCLTASDEKVGQMIQLKDINSRLQFFQSIIFDLGAFKQISPMAKKLREGLTFLIPTFKCEFQTKSLKIGDITITKEIWDYIVYLVKLCCGEKISKPLVFDSPEAEAFWKKQQEMDARIKKLKQDNSPEGDNKGLIKQLIAINYSFPSLSIDYLHNQTMAQIHWLRELAAGEVSYRLQSQAAAAGNIKKGSKLNFFIK